jgi:diamine N-acetyltransferase
MRLVPATEADLPLIADLEARPEYDPFINRWPVERHRALMTDPDYRYMVFEEDGARVGYVILSGLASHNSSILLARIALDRSGGGRGRACIELIMAEVFDAIGAHRLHLDLFEDNARARHLYLALGFRDEGFQVEAERRGEVYRSLRLMAILEQEYRSRTRTV